MTTIAYLVKMYPRFSETFVVNEILELERQGLNVRIYSLHRPNDGRFHASLARVQAQVIYTPEFPLAEAEKFLPAHRALFKADRSRYLRVLSNVLTARDDDFEARLKYFLKAGFIADHLLRHPVDAVHAHFATSATRVAGLVHDLIGTPYSFTAHAKDIYHRDVNIDSLRQKIGAARFVVTVSEFNRLYLQDLTPEGVGDIRRLFNGIDLEMFRPNPATPREPNLILGVGRLIEKKGWEDLIRACALLAEHGSSFRCEIIGNGSLEGKLRKLIAELGLSSQVKLVGARPQDEVLAAYRRATVFALPCIVGQDGNRDGLPTVLLEAMAAGLPVISTDVTGVPEIIDDNVDGLLTPQNNPAALARALDRLLVSPALRERFSAAARRKVEREFDVRQNVAVLHYWLAGSTSTQAFHTPVAYAQFQAAH
ncbi:MAG: glycosyltransferase [Chloroflexi bacterium]|nr:glycosyltransferase [Chloroflexota bacterium]